MSAEKATTQTTFAETREFLTNVLPPEPISYMAWMQGEKLRHRPHTNNLIDAAITVRDKSNAGLDVYFALAGFKVAKIQRGDFMVANRKQVNVDAIRALILDVDDKQYGQTVDTLTAVLSAIKFTEMPKPSYIVNSGGGLHVYWLLEIPMDVLEHRKRSTLLAYLFKQAGLKADYGCTIDSARVLRPPGTLNHKYTPAREVHILLNFQGWTNPEALDTALGTAKASNVVSIDPAMREAIGDDSNEALAGSHKYVAAQFSRILEECPMSAATLANHGEGDSYNKWKNILHLAAFTEDGHDFIHELSNGHEGYTSEKTAEKYQESVTTRETDGDRVGPTTCEIFNEDCDECQSCPHFGKIKSPFSLGTPTASEVHAEGEDPTFVRRGSTYRVLYVPHDEMEGEYERTEPKIADFEVSGFTVAYYGLLNETILTFKVVEQASTFTISISTPDLADTMSVALSHELALRSIMMSKKALLSFREALMAWVNALRARAASNGDRNVDTSGYGWCQSGSKLVPAFAYNGTVYHSDGTSVPGQAHDALADIYRTEGTLEAWKASAAALCEDPRIALQTVLAASFAAPLMRYFPDTPSFTLSLMSSVSGAGKSTALRVAAAVWAEPTRSMRQLNDTTNALIRHMAMARDMPAYWDDIRGDKRVDGFLEVMFQLTQGREKERLNRSAKTTPVGILRTILTVASNSSVLERITDRDRTSDATARRVLEFKLEPMANNRMDQAKRDIFHAAKTNYGHAGQMLAEWLPQNEERILAWKKHILSMLQSQLRADSEDRFWIDACAAILMGALIAKELDLAPINFSDLLHFLIDHTRKQKVVVTADVLVAVEDLLADFLTVNADYTIRCSKNTKNPHKRGRATARAPLVESHPVRGIAEVEINVDAREVVFSSPAINHYLNCRRGSSHTAQSLINALAGHYPMTHEKRTLGRGTNFTSGQRWCRVIKFTTEAAFREIIDKTP